LYGYTEGRPLLFRIRIAVLNPGGRHSAFEWGTSSLVQYDGTSLAQSQDIVVVSFNYRMNVFGFPSSPDIPLAHNNLGYLDQELALRWVQDNIAAFNGDKTKVTIMVRLPSSIDHLPALTYNTSYRANPPAPTPSPRQLRGTRQPTRPFAPASCSPHRR
jgi:hypothetical protein